MQLLEKEEDEEDSEELKKLIVKTKSMIEACCHEEIVSKIGESSGKNINVETVKIHVNQTRGRSKSKGRARSNSRSKSRGRWTEALGILTTKQVRFKDDDESQSEMDEKIVDFLQELKLSQYAHNFKFNKMTYHDLPGLDNLDLFHIGVDIKKHRKVILEAVEKRKKDVREVLTNGGYTLNDVKTAIDWLGHLEENVIKQFVEKIIQVLSPTSEKKAGTVRQLISIFLNLSRRRYEDIPKYTLNDVKAGIELVRSGHLEENVLQQIAEKLKQSLTVLSDAQYTVNDVKTGIELVRSGHLEENVLQQFSEKIKQSLTITVSRTGMISDEFKFTVDDVKASIALVRSGLLDNSVLQQFVANIKQSVGDNRGCSKVILEVLSVLCTSNVVSEVDDLRIVDVDIDDIEGIVETVGKVSKYLCLCNATVTDEKLIKIFAATCDCDTLSITGMTLSESVSSSLGKCVNNNISEFGFGGGFVTFNFHLFSACVTDQSKCFKIECWDDTADKYRDDFKQFCQQSKTWDVTLDNPGFITVEKIL